MFPCLSQVPALAYLPRNGTTHSGLSFLHQLASKKCPRTFTQGILVQAVLRLRTPSSSGCVKQITKVTRTALDGKQPWITATSWAGVGIKLLSGSVKDSYGPLVSWLRCWDSGETLAQTEWGEKLLAAASEDQHDLRA